MSDEELVRDFGLRPLGERADDLLVRRLENAVTARLAAPLSELSMTYDRADILEGDSYYYLPVCWIGCSGMLVLKNDFAVVVFGSSVGAATHLWAWLRGIEPDLDAGNDLVIRAVRNEAETLRCLKSIWTARYVRNTLAPKLRTALPVRVPNANLYFGIGELRKAETNGWFEFDIEPATAGDPDTPPEDAEKRRPFS